MSESLHQPLVAAASSPCAACKMLRRRCGEKCVLAPYFPSSDLQKFATAHKIYGASNIIKLLQDLPVDKRADAVSSMVYEAAARMRDPVYGCAGAICLLQQQLSKLQSQLAITQAELLNMHLRQAKLLGIVAGSVDICGEALDPFSPTHSGSQDSDHNEQYSSAFVSYSADNPMDQLWESIWA